MIVLGVMSGSSMDGLDLALVEFRPAEDEVLDWSLLAQKTFPLSDTLKSHLSTVRHQVPAELVKTMDNYTQELCEAIAKFLSTTDSRPELIGIHGHTIIHSPESNFSWQMVNGAYVAETARLPVVTNFRNNDIALGGQGTPMAVFSDRTLFSGYDFYINLGGIANISFHNGRNWSAYDLCGCNQLLNHLAQQEGKAFDKDGTMASVGKLDRALLDSLLSLPYLQQESPKSLDNGEVQAIITNLLNKSEASIVDKLHTVTIFISQVVHDNLHKSTEVKRLLVTGGGAHNTFLINELHKKCALQNVTVNLPEITIIDYKEAILISHTAYCRYLQLANFVSEATGATSDAIGGAVYLPSNLKL